MTVLAEALVLQRAATAQGGGLRDAVNGPPGGALPPQFRLHEFGRAFRIELRTGALADVSPLVSSGLRPATPFQNRAWMTDWQAKVGDARGVLPVTAVAYSGKVPVFALPLAVTRRFGTRVLTWHGAQLNDYCAPLAGEAFRGLAAGIDGARVMTEIARMLGGIDLVVLSKSPRQIEGAANPFVFGNALSYHARAHAIALPAGASFESFYAARRSTKTRRRIKEKLNALEKLGKVEFRFADSAAEAREVSALCLAAKSRQLQANGHWDPFSDAAVRDYVVSSFAKEPGRSTWACSLSCGGEILATAVGFRSARSWLLYQMSMEDSGKERYSPGTHLLMNLLKRCIDERAEELDLGLGDESYKGEWCNVDKELAVSTLALSAKGRVMEQIVRTRARILSRLSSDPVLHARAKRLQNAARKLRIPL